MLRLSEIWFLTLGLQIVLSRPAEEPIKFNLYGPEQYVERFVEPEKEIVTTKFQRGKDNVSESQNILQNVIPPKHQQTYQANNLQSYIQNPFPVINSARARESAKLEFESDQGIFERPKENPLRQFLEKLSRPTPIVDGIKEEQKYGNNGDKFMGIGRALVNGFEGLSNFVNVVIDLPMRAAKQTSQGLTEALNRVGARLVGLQ